jgi:deoxyadenosine/deoxycytidine kinase
MMFCCTVLIHIFYRGLHIALEGGIAVGKSSLLKAIAARFAEIGVEVCPILEPVDEWMDYGPDHVDLLAHMYDNPLGFSYLFQVMALTTKFQQLGPYLAADKDHLLVERTLGAQKHVFIPLLHEKGYINTTEKATLDMMIDSLEYATDPDLIVFIKSSPNICLERVQKRGREAEKDIRVEYLRAVEEQYRVWESTAENSIQIVTGDDNIEVTAKRVVTKIFIWAVKNNQLKRLLGRSNTSEVD